MHQDVTQGLYYYNNNDIDGDFECVTHQPDRMLKVVVCHTLSYFYEKKTAEALSQKTKEFLDRICGKGSKMTEG